MTTKQIIINMNPGSKPAVMAGCLCPVAENRNGDGVFGSSCLFWIHEDCPLHGKDKDVPKP